MISSDEQQASQKRKILIFENSHILTSYLLKKWVEMVHEAVQRSNRFTVALSGGRSPIEFYSRLSAFKDFDLWSRTHVFLGDERFVPFSDGNSNFKMIKENLLDYISLPPENIHPITTDQKNVDLAADQFKNELVQFFEFNENNVPSFDMILLGVGTDGHTASLFPDDEHIEDMDRLVLPVTLPHLKEERITLTLPVINSARNVVFLILGTNKAEILQEMIKGESGIPASKVNLTTGQLTYLVDKEAACKLSYRDSCSHEDQGVLYIEAELTER